MTRFHLHISVNNLDESIRFYSTLFAAKPTVLQSDYAKWMLEDPRINFAISTHHQPVGVNHLGFQVDSGEELRGLHTQLQAADSQLIQEDEQPCCYAKSDKYWVTDPTGIAWETFHTLGSIPVYGEDTPVFNHGATTVPNTSACCVPAAKVNEPISAPRPSMSDSAIPVTIYHNPACGTSRNTLALIRNAGVEPTVIQYLKTPPDRATLESLLQRMGIRPRDLLRQKGTPYDELGLGADHWTDGELIDQMLEHPILINRPIVVTPWGAKLCRPSEAVLDILPIPQKGPFAKEDGKPLIDAEGRRVD